MADARRTSARKRACAAVLRTLAAVLLSHPAALLSLAAVAGARPAAASAPDAAALFARYADRIVQVRLVDREAGKKASFGTGFVVVRDGLIATNYHVVAEWIHQPGKYRLEATDQAGATRALELLDIDVVNDLALLRSEPSGLEPLALPDGTPNRGETIYSLGNPHDIGFTVIPGTYNGLDERSYYPQIHFSGSINAGMSGGPVLDAGGSVVGVNVATAGNQISFLVPVSALRALLDAWQRREAPIEDFAQRIREQLLANQQTLVGDVLAGAWPTQPLGEATIAGELLPFVRCWGNSNRDDELFHWVSSSCQSSRRIYVSRAFRTGVIAYQFFWMEPGEIGWLRLRRYYESLFSSFVADNSVSEDDVTEFVCDEYFVRDDAEHVDKTLLCVRSYKDYPDLYDALYASGSVDATDHAFISHFTLAGVTRDSVAAFLERFREVVAR